MLRLIAPSGICHICHAPVEACPVQACRVPAPGPAWVSNRLLAGRAWAAGWAVVDAAERLGARACLASALSRQASVRRAGGGQAAGRGPRQPRLCPAPLCSRAARVTCRAAEAAHSSSSPHMEPSKLQEAAPKLEGESSAGSPLSAVVTGSPVQQSGRRRTSSRERASEPRSDGGGRRSPRPLAG